MRWVLGSMGPGTKLPSLGHTTYDYLKQTFALQAEGLIDGGADAFLIETSQDLLQTKAAVNGCKQAIVTRGIRLPIFVEVTVETTGTMLMGSEIGAALTALEPLGVDAIGLNCATGPDEMSEHLRHLSKQSSVAIACMPNAGLPCLAPTARTTRSHPANSPPRTSSSCGNSAWASSADAAVRRRSTWPPSSNALRPSAPQPCVTSSGNGAARVPTEREAGIASLYHHVPFDQESAYLAIGERTNANGSKAFRQAMLDERWDDCVDIAREQVRVGAHLLDVCIDYVGRDGVADIKEIVSRFASASTLPLVIDSTEPPVLQAGLELIGGRPVVNSVNYEDGDGPDSRFARIMPLVKEHGTAVIALTIDEQGQARTTEGKVAIASRLVDALVGEWGMRVEDIIVDALTFPIATGQEETRRDGIETIEAIRQITAKYPGIHTTLGVSNVSFGLNPAARMRPELGVPARGRAGRPDQRHHRRRQDRAARLAPGGTAQGGAGPRLGPPRIRRRRQRHLRPAGHACWTSSPASTPQRSRTSAPRNSPRCPPANACSGASSTAKARASKRTSTWPAAKA